MSKHLEERNGVKYLGNRIDNKFLFRGHINYIRQICHQFNSVFFKLRQENVAIIDTPTTVK